MTAETTSPAPPGKEPIQWTEVIVPETGWFAFRLGELWRYRHLITRFFRRDFVSSYKQTILGPFWFVLPPLVTSVVFTVIFGRIGRISTDGMPDFLFFNLGIIAWNFFSACLTRAATTLSSNAGLFGKVYFPRLVVPISTTLSNLVTFAIQFVVFLIMYGIVLAQGGQAAPNWRIVILPLLLLQMAALGLGAGFMVSALTTRFRDLALMVSFGTQLWMYASCVVFPLSQIPKEWRLFFILNPMVPIIEAFRFALLGGGIVEIWHIAVSGAISGLVLFLGLIMFKRAERTFMDTV